MGRDSRLSHLFTVDVEDYFHSEDPDVSAWGGHELRVESSTRTLLESCERAGVRGTFFVLGWVAERRPQLVRDLAAAGHEIASHGYAHRFVYRQSPAEFSDDIRRARDILEGITGLAVRGYRAPYFSIVAETPWAYEALAATGHEYSSSVFPGANPRYGIRGHGQEPRLITTETGATVREIPVTTFYSRIGCGGIYFRALPYRWFAGAISARERAGRRTVFYLHPWELDPGNPLPSPIGLRLRHSIGLSSAQTRLDRLLKEFAFEAIAPPVGAQQCQHAPERASTAPTHEAVR